MLNSTRPRQILTFINAGILSLLFVLSSCMPTSTAPRIEANNSSGEPGSTPQNPSGDYQEPIYPLQGTFIQEGATRSATNISIPVLFTDSFLIRGLALSQYLRTIPLNTKMCFVGKYNYSGSDKFLLLSAKASKFTDLINKTTEYYLKVEPDNATANQNDCSNFNLTSMLFSGATSPSAHFSFRDLCTNCSTAVSSTSLRLFFMNGQEVPSLNVSSLILTLAGSLSSGGSDSCVESTSCRARGFDCCLQSQCVRDGAERPGASLLPGYLAAKEDVRVNPSRFIYYPQFYFVCESRPDGTTTGGSSGGSTNDPNYEATVRLMELKQLSDCINKVDGEFSHCTLKFTQANTLIPTPGVFSAGIYKDDVNFSSINPNLNSGTFKNNIYKIVYGGQTLYQQGVSTLPVSGLSFGVANDSVTSSSQTVTISSTLPLNAQDANLYLTYKVDGTCQKVGTTSAKCVKTFIHNYVTDPTSSMWHDNTPVYRLPVYADLTTDNIIVKVSGNIVAPGADTWNKTTSLPVSYPGQSPQGIVFSTNFDLFQNQTVEITYYVMGADAQNLTALKDIAQTKVNQMCTCASSAKCNLLPVLGTDGTSVVNYECSYPTADSGVPPANQTVYVSNKNIAHRYFDSFGVNYDENIPSSSVQEGTAFAYTNNDVLKPNNVTPVTPIGFNEIYGSFAKTGTYIARPAKLVKVKKDQFYDITTNSGTFSSCLTCGSDYYSTIQKIFPQNFGGQGGGYAPDNYESSRQNSSSIYRSDDLLYGRACFVPATMIPWTHSLSTASTPRDQRRDRLAAQHFLFANGYNRDWYGFDYGSLIGSFDGVKWFSIGNQRRIKSTTNKLFLAVNAYLGDLNVDGNFNVSVTETTSFSSSVPDHDTETDGAQCQKSHYCSTDKDCFSSLGYDYSCQNVATITTQWPTFDGNGSETVGSTVRSLVSLVGGSNGQSKRCVYRGRGAPCLSNLDNASTADNFNGSTAVGTLMCSPNTSCTPLTATGRFNDRIARFANTPAAQNAVTPQLSPTPSDTVGLGARVILRPFDYYGTKSVDLTLRNNLADHNITAICTPGKNIAAATDMYDLNSRTSNTVETSDKIFGVGPTLAGFSSRSLNACPATDAAGNTMQLYDLPLGDSQLNTFSVSQNLSSNLLDLSVLSSQNIFSSTGGTQITSVGYQRNSCLRAPGASCFSDMECAPSAFVGVRARAVNLASVLNEAEAKYWGEDLVCGNPDFKYLSPGVKNPDFDVKKNVCCREFGKAFTVYTETDTSAYKWCSGNNIQVAGVTTALSTASRYSRVHTGYDKMTCNRAELGTKTFALSVAGGAGITAADKMQQILGQYKTLDAVNERTCCTKNWVRSFATENGGGHAFSKTKFQNIDKFMWRNISWNPDDEVTVPNGDAPFECQTDQYLSPNCEIKSLTPDEEEKYLTWAGTLELIGIPQVAIKSNDQVYKLVSDTQTAIAPGAPLTDTDGKKVLLEVASVGADFQDLNGSYYSAASYSKLNMESVTKNSLKKVFSENEFNCCVPSGQEVPSTTTASQCCTGYVANIGGPRRCCLPDFTDITIYLNRYVSSEGRGLPDAAYDKQTGYIKDIGQVQLMAAQKNLCCSGKVMTGVAINRLSIPSTSDTYKTPVETSNTSRRFNYRSDAVDDNAETDSIGSIYDRGVRWNNHVYCVPDGFPGN